MLFRLVTNVTVLIFVLLAFMLMTIYSAFFFVMLRAFHKIFWMKLCNFRGDKNILASIIREVLYL